MSFQSHIYQHDYRLSKQYFDGQVLQKINIDVVQYRIQRWTMKLATNQHYKNITYWLCVDPRNK